MTSQITPQLQRTNNQNYSDIIPISTHQKLNKFSEITNMKTLPQSSNLNKSHQYTSRDIRFNKLNMNSSLNIPSPNTATNISLNEQILHQNKEQNPYFDNDVSDQEEDEIDPIFKEYTMINNRRNKTIDEIKNIKERIKNNKLKIEEIKQNLIKLKEEKRQKQADIVNLLSNKESIEEIYKNQIYLLINHINGNNNINNNFNENTTLNNDLNNLINISKNNDISDNSMINLNSMHNITILDNEILNTDEDNFKITFKEIKESDQKKYIEQVINMFDDIFQKKDEKINSSITSIINNSYELFINNNISIENEKDENNKELIVTNFFGKMSIFISNHSLGKYSEAKINLFLRYLLKINSIGTKLSKYIKFVNKKYKEKKKELNDMISFLEKKNINLVEKNHRLENNIKEYEERLEFFGKNDVFEIEQNYEGDEFFDNNNKELNEDINSSSNKKNDNIINRNRKNTKIRNINSTIEALNSRDNLKKEIENLEKNIGNEDRLSHDVVIEYEDGIDQNAEINYEEDDLNNDYDYEKTNEMINQGLNPYSGKNISNQQKIDNKKNLLLNKQRNKINDKKQMTLNDNDESDKYLKEFLQNKEEKKDNLIQGKNMNNIEILDNNLKNKKTKRNSKNVIRTIPIGNQSPNINNRNIGFQLAKKINYNTSYNNKRNNTYINTINNTSDNKIYPSFYIQNNYDDDDLENQYINMELEHYNRAQKIMNSGPNISNIFGVNNYNPENDVNRDILFSPKKNISNDPNSSNKIDKTIRYGTKKNHNFISIINMTKSVPLKKKNEKEKSRTREKSKKRKEIENDGTIKVINLEENFLNEISTEGIKNENETENKIGNESTSMLTKSNNLESNTNNSKSMNISHGSKNNDNNKSNNNIINENIENEDNINIVNKNKVNKNNINNKNEVQGYFLNIINSKELNNNKKNINNNKYKEEDNLNNKLENNDFFNNSTVKTLKITKSRELNINDIKNNKLIITKKNVKKIDKPKPKLIYLKNKDTKESNLSNKSQTKLKENSSLNKITTINNKLSQNNLTSNKSANNSFVNINESSMKRTSSLKEYQEPENNKYTIIRNKQNTTKKYSSNNIIVSSAVKKGKISNIPLSKTKVINNKNYNTYTFEGNFKSGLKKESSNINNINKK